MGAVFVWNLEGKPMSEEHQFETVHSHHTRHLALIATGRQFDLATGHAVASRSYRPVSVNNSYVCATSSDAPRTHSPHCVRHAASMLCTTVLPHVLLATAISSVHQRLLTTFVRIYEARLLP